MSNSFGIYELPLSPGVYTFDAEPPADAEGVREPAGLAAAVSEDDAELPKIEMGVVNRRQAVINLAGPLRDLGVYDVDRVAGFNFPFIDKLGTSPYADEVAAAIALAQSFPVEPTPTVERLYRLWLAIGAARSIAADADLMSDQLEAVIIDLIGDLVNLGNFNEKLAKGIQDQFNKTSDSIPIRGSTVRRDAATELVAAAENSSGKYTNELRRVVGDNLLAGAGYGYAQFLNTLFVLGAVDQYPENYVKAGAERLDLFRLMLAAHFAWQTQGSLQKAVETAAIFSPNSDRLPEEANTILSAIQLSGRLTQQKLASVENFLSSTLSVNEKVKVKSEFIGTSLAALLRSLHRSRRRCFLLRGPRWNFPLYLRCLRRLGREFGSLTCWAATSVSCGSGRQFSPGHFNWASFQKEVHQSTSEEPGYGLRLGSMRAFPGRPRRLRRN